MIRILSILWLLPLAALADEKIDSVTPGDVELQVKPVLCIVDQRTPSCDMAFEVTWQSETEGYYCISCDLEGEPLHCWADEHQGELKDERSVLEDFSYMINRGTGKPALDAVTVEVVRMSSEDRRRKRRTRHIWDVL